MTLAGIVGLWLGVHWTYVIAMAAKNALGAGKLTLYWRVMLYPAAVLGVLLDFVFQLTFGWVMFLETLKRGGWLFSGRVQHHFLHSDGWRKKLAIFWARNLNVFDPDHIHAPR